MPAELLQTPEAGILAAEADEKVYNLIQLIYRAKNYEGNAKDYEFSRRTMEDHWRSGYNDAVRTLRHPEVLQRPNGSDGLFTIGAHRIWRSLFGGDPAQSREPLLDMTGGRIIRGRGMPDRRPSRRRSRQRLSATPSSYPLLATAGESPGNCSGVR